MTLALLAAASRARDGAANGGGFFPEDAAELQPAFFWVDLLRRLDVAHTGEDFPMRLLVVEFRARALQEVVADSGVGVVCRYNGESGFSLPDAHLDAFEEVAAYPAAANADTDDRFRGLFVETQPTRIGYADGGLVGAGVDQRLALHFGFSHLGYERLSESSHG